MSLPEHTITTRPDRDSFAHRLRRWVVGAIIVSFGIAALGGIFVLLSGSWSDTAAKVLATTGLTGLFSVAVLCGAALLGKSAQAFGWVTIIVSVVTLAVILTQLWTDADWGDAMFKTDVTLCALSAACAVASLLLLLVAHDRRAVRTLLFVTLGLIALAVLLTLLPVWNESIGDSDAYWRSAGVVWILAALGTVVLPVLSLLLRGPRGEPAETPVTPVPAQEYAQDPGATATGGLPGAPAPQLSAASIERIASAARAQGVTADELVERLLP